MKKHKNWLKVIPASAVLFTLTSCFLAKGTYINRAERLEGLGLSSKNDGYFTCSVETSASGQVFSALAISFTNSSVKYAYGTKTANIVATVSASEDFSNSIEGKYLLSSGVNTTYLTIDFDQTEVLSLKANKLFIKVTIDIEEDDDAFDSSWVVLKNMEVYGNECSLAEAENRIAKSEEVDFTISGLSSLETSQNLEAAEKGLILSQAATSGKFIYKIEGKSGSTSSFDTLSLDLKGTLKDYTVAIGEEGTSETKTIKSSYNIYVSNSTQFDGEPVKTIHSTKDGVEETAIDLTDYASRAATSTLYVQVEMITDEAIPSSGDYVSLTSMKVTYAETKKYFDVNFKETTLDDVINSNVAVNAEYGLIPASTSEAGYVVYEMETEADSEGNHANAFQSLKVVINDGMLKDYSYLETDENGVEKTKTVKTYWNFYVSDNNASFPEEPTKRVTSTREGITSQVVDLTNAVMKLGSPVVYVRISLTADETFESTDNYLSIGKVSFVGTESKEATFLEKDLSTVSSDAKFTVENMEKHTENAKETKIILKSKSKCEVQKIEYDENNNVVSTYTSTVCTWGEKGPGYTGNYVARMNGAQLEVLKKAYGSSLGTSLDEGVMYSGSVKIDGKNIEVKIFKIQEQEDLYEVIYYAGETKIMEESLKKEALKYSADVFADFVPAGNGNVVYVEYDGVRDLYVHNGKTLIKTTDSSLYRK